jgi:hypothetical protein
MKSKEKILTERNSYSFFPCLTKIKMTERVFFVKMQELRDNDVQTSLTTTDKRVGGPVGKIELSKADLYQVVTKHGQEKKKKVGTLIHRLEITYQSGVLNAKKVGTVDIDLKLDSGEVIAFSATSNDILSLSVDQLRANPNFGVALGTSISNNDKNTVKTYAKQFNITTSYDANKDRLVYVVVERK